MALKGLLLMLASAPLASTETVLGVYMLHRHGDRTAKAHKPVNLTALGAEQVYASGGYYRQRYVESDAAVKIFGLSSDIAIPSQVTVQSPVDAVLQISAQAFLQSLYPPVGSLGVQELADGTEVSYPFDGYQYVPVNTDAASNDHSENNEWLQAGSGCGNALVSSNSYFFSDEYASVYKETEGLYQSLIPIINATFDEDEATFKNGYTIWDLLNVALIHNKTIPESDLLTNSTMESLKTYADIHEWNLAYNSSSEIRAIAGKVLAGHVLRLFRATISEPSTTPQFGVEFGAYATFMSFFGLADLPAASPDFKGIVNYASSMAFELFTDANVTDADSWPEDDGLMVRFVFANGTASSTNEPAVFPLFGLGRDELPWPEFESEMRKFAINNEEEWCTACGNSTGYCATYNRADNESSDNPGGDCGGLSPVGIAMISVGSTLALVLAALCVLYCGFGMRCVRKNTTASSGNNHEEDNKLPF